MCAVRPTMVHKIVRTLLVGPQDVAAQLHRAHVEPADTNSRLDRTLGLLERMINRTAHEVCHEHVQWGRQQRARSNLPGAFERRGRVEGDAVGAWWG